MTTRHPMIANLRERIDPSMTDFDGPLSSLPAFWHGYVSNEPEDRRAALHAELAALAPYLPQTIAALQSVAADAFMATSTTCGVLRVITTQIDGEPFGIVSRLPVSFAPVSESFWGQFEANAPQVLTWLYNTRMDGLTDAFGFAGFKPLQSITTMRDEIDTYGEQSWFESFAAAHDTSAIIEILATGGSGYLLLDLSRDQSGADDPDGLFVALDEGTAPQTIGFFPYLDELMKIGLTGR